MSAPSFVLARIGSRRIALPGDGVSELISAPSIHRFPHTTPLIAGVVLRRGRIVPVIDLGPGAIGEASPPTRFFLVVDRQFGTRRDRCAIPVQGECELVTGTFVPSESSDEDSGCVIGRVEVNGETIDVLGIERTIAAGAGASVSDAETPGQSW